jgi:mono/diheme cytochrome c family protein
MKKALGLLMGVAMTAAMTATVAAQDAKKIEAGKALFTAQKCTQCHKVGGVGGKLASELDGVGKKLKEEEIRQWLTNPGPLEAKITPKPKVTMSGYLKTHKLSDADVDALVAYMASLK